MTVTLFYSKCTCTPLVLC